MVDPQKPWMWMQIPNVISATSVNASLTMKRPGTGFHAWATGASEQTTTDTCHVSMVAWHSFQPIENHAPWNMPLEQEPWNLPPIETCQVSAMLPNVHFDVQGARTLETCNISGAMFQPRPPILYVPPCDHHPCPITHPSRFRPFSTFLHFVLLSLDYSIKTIKESNGIGF